jgi:hypothetical protein
MGVLYSRTAASPEAMTEFTLGDAGAGGAVVAGFPNAAGSEGVAVEILQTE